MLKKGLSIIIVLMLITVVTGFSSAEEQPWERYDFGGETIRLAAHSSIYETQFDDGAGRAHLEWVEDVFNVNIEFYITTWDVLMREWNEHVLVGDPIADAARVDAHWMFGYAPEGTIYPIEELDNYEEYLSRLPAMHADYYKQYGQYRGTVYGFSDNPYNRYWGIIWNKDLFEREGLPDLYELQEAGEWTWDALLDIAERATRDTTGDGEIDQWGLSAGQLLPRDGAHFQKIILAGVTNNARLNKTVDGREVLCWDSEEAVENIQLWYDLLQIGALYMPMGLDATEAFYAGETAMHFANCQQVFPDYDEFDGEAGWVFFPMGPRADSYKSMAAQTTQWVIEIGVEQPEAVLELVNALYKLTTPYIDLEDYDDEWYGWYGEKFHDYESMETFMQMVENYEYLLYYYGHARHGYSHVINEVMNGEISMEAVPSRLAEEKPARQARFDEFLGQ